VLEEEAELGILALERGMIPQDSLNDCLTQVSEKGTSLIDLLRSRKLLTAAQIDELLTEARRRVRGRGEEDAIATAAGRDADPSETRTLSPPPRATAIVSDLEPTRPPPPISNAIPAEANRAAKDPANLFGKFIRVDLAGKGSLGQVYKAYDTEGARWVALKILNDQGGGSEGVDRFIKEAQAHVGLEHPGIAAILDAGRQREGGADRAYIAMEFVEGETLDRVQARGIKINRAAEIIRDAARAVEYAHRAGVIHRDLKPHNVMLSFDGPVRVTDFGLAGYAATLGPSEDSMLSREIQVQGTPQYMSPEQALGRTSDIRERSDVYQLGATLYFLLTGKPPHDAGNPMKTCFAVVREPLVPPSKLNPQVSENLDRIIVRAMAKDPVRRYESASTMASDLDRFIQGGPVLSDDQLRLTQGISALHAGRLEEAIHMFKDLLKLESAGKLGETGIKAVTKQIEEGENGVTLAIKQQTKNYDIRTQRGVYRFAKAIIQSLEGNDPGAGCKSALEDFVSAADMRAESTAARVNRANVLIFGGRAVRDSGKDVSSVFQMALKDLDAAVSFDNTCSPAYHNRGIVYFYMARSLKKGSGDPEPFYRKAIDDFSRAAELEQTYAYVFKDLGVVKVALAKHLLSQGQKVKNLFIEAIAHLEIAVRLNPNIYGAYYERGQAYFAVKDFKSAIADFRRCVELDPTRDKKVQALIDEAQKHIDSRRT
jgi:serine/threonine protein kinase